MSKEKNLFKNIVIYAIGNFSSKFLSFILLPFYTFYLSTNDYGYFDLITTSLMLITPLVTFQIFDGLYRYLLTANDETEKAQIISNSLVIVFRNLIIFNLIYLAATFLVDFQYKYLILLQLDASIIANLWMQIARGLRNNVKYSMAGILMTAVVLGGNLIFIIFFKFRVNGLIISNILAALMVMVFLESSLKIRNFIHFKQRERHFLKELTSYSFPLVPNALSWWFMNVSDRYLLNYFKGIEANGIYAVANKFPSIIILVNSIFNMAWQESAISEYNSRDRDQFYTKTFNRIFRLEFTVIFVLLAFTRLIMSYMVNSKFSSAWLYIPFLYFGAVFSTFSTFYGTGYQSSKETKGAFYTTAYGALLNLGINLILTPYIGIQGASLATMLAFLVVWLIRIHQTKKYFTIRIDRVNLIILPLIALIFTWLYYQNYPYTQPLLMSASIILFIVFNRELLAATPLSRLKGWNKGR
ncbi:MAG TPA: polysaccharide biosynthesis C-terminal domain-containing protein [Bacillota bacterium]|nr:polysaccharide biosynthesis C-terminal domain-containing protein [Bacillota bacterium]